VRLLLPVLLLAALGAGYWAGAVSRKRAVLAAYAELQPVVVACRQLVVERDSATQSFAAARALAQHELDRYDSELRALG
jgi:hypothetical protein